MNRLLVLALLVPFAASAVPLELNHQGRLLDSSGVPLTSTEDVTFAIYGDLGDTEAAWTETHSITFDEGYYNAQLGSIEDLDSDLFDGSSLFVGITVGTDPELTDRLPLASVPYAVKALSADSALTVAGGAVDASSVSVGGTEVISADGTIDYSAITNAPSDPLADLTCETDEVVTWDGSAWACGSANSPHQHAGEDITSGTISAQRLPVGGGADEVAAGDHTHDASAIVSGSLDNARLPADISVTSVTAGSLVSSGTVQLGTSSATCDDSLAGALREGDGNDRIEACVGGAWVPLAIERGHSAATPGSSCDDIYNSGVRTDGTYFIDPKNTGSAYEAYCDMEADGGGWTLILKTDDTNPAALRYAGALWTDSNLLNEGEANINAGVAKLQTYLDVSFTEMRACFPSEDGYCYSKEFSSTQASAVATFNGGANDEAGHPGIKAEWSTQPNCKRFGVNPSVGGRLVRFGYTANQENNCASNDTSLGFGTWGNASGVECTSSQCSRGNVNTTIPGYLWVR